MSFYRKHRPQKFSELIGQDHIRQTLANALMMGSFSHGYLFTGSKGSGKTTTARLLAKALNCEGRVLGKDSFEPCNKCRSCKEITVGSSIDIMEIDAASNRGIDEMRELRDKIRFAPNVSKYKVYIIDECHMLTKEAFNALLKTLEEPPAHAIFILATTELQKVPATILSRVQVFDFRKAKTEEIMKLLNKIVKAEGLNISDDALALISHLAFGAYRDALSILDQASTLQTDKRKSITLEQVQLMLGQSTEGAVWDYVKYLAENDRKQALKLVEKIYFEGKDLSNFVAEVVRLLRELLLKKSGLETEFDITPENKKNLELLSNSLEIKQIVTMIEKHIEVSGQIKTAVLGQLPLEMVVFILTSEKMSNIKCQMSNEDTEKAENNIKEEKKDEEIIIVEEKIEVISKPVEKTSIKSFSPELWQKVFKEVKVHNNTLAAILKDANFQSSTDGTIILAVKFKFHAEQINRKNNLQVIEAIILKVAGKPYKLDCVVDPDLKVTKPIEAEEVLLENAKEVFEID